MASSMKQYILIVIVAITLVGCGDPNSLDNIEFVKRNLENKNLHEKLLTTEQSQGRSPQHKALFQTISTSYHLLEQSKTEQDRFTAYQYAELARATYYSKEADYQAVYSAKKLEDVTGLYRRVEPYFNSLPADFIFTSPADTWDLYDVIEQVKSSADLLYAVSKVDAVRKNNNQKELKEWLDHTITRQYQEIQTIIYILIQASETQKTLFYTDKKPIEKDAERILAGVSSSKARQMLKPDIYAWQQKNLWRYELVNNSCMVLDEKIRESEIAKDCRLLLNAYKNYTIEPDEFANFVMGSRMARNRLVKLVAQLKQRYNYSTRIEKSIFTPQPSLNKLMVSLKKDFYRTTPSNGNL